MNQSLRSSCPGFTNKIPANLVNKSVYTRTLLLLLGCRRVHFLALDGTNIVQVNIFPIKDPYG
jgi:hypothetical protein